TQPVEVLDRQGIVEPQLIAHLRDQVGLRLGRGDARGGRAKHRIDRVTGDEVEDREDEDRRQDQHRDRLHEARPDELRHQVREPALSARPAPRSAARRRRSSASSGGWTFRNVRYTRASYTIFRPAARKNGRPSAAALNAIPANVGETALAVVRATFVIPAVAVRSSGSTTAMV